MKKHLYQSLAILAIAAVVVACGGGQTATEAPAASTPAATEAATTASSGSGSIAVSGAFALYPMMVTWAQEYQKIHPDVKIDVSAGGAGKGMADTLAGAVDIGMVSRKITDDEISKGAYPVGVTRDAVFGVVNAKNPVLADLQKTGFTPDIVKKIFLTGEYKTWGDVVGKPDVKDAIHVFNRSDAAGAADVWAQYAGGKAQADIKQGIGVNGDPGLLAAVIKDPLGIGFNNLNYAFDVTTGKVADGAAIIPLDANKNGSADPEEIFSTSQQAADAVANGKYPSPPARIEWLVTKGAPKGVTKDFITWILNDGQKLLATAGYVPLTADQLATEQAKVK